MESTVKISLVTTCKGRLSYLRQSIVTWLDLDYNNYEIVVVDYDCPDHTREYIRQNKDYYLKQGTVKELRVMEVNEKPYFNLNDARNIGIDATDGELILMIDSDVHIIDKTILTKIEDAYKKGVVFFSNHQILHSKYFEANVFYRMEFQMELLHPVLVPAGFNIPSLSGTACFIKSYYQRYGKFRPEISQQGFGWDEIEFYLRYLNHFFYRDYLPQIDIKDHLVSNHMDRVLGRFSLFADDTFLAQLNKDEEKDEFYPASFQETREKNKQFIMDFFNIHLQAIAGKKLNKDEHDSIAPGNVVNKVELFKYNRYKKIPVARWYKGFIYKWYGIKLFEAKRYEESVFYFKNILEEKDCLSKYRYSAHYYLGEIKRLKGLKGWKLHYRKAAEILENRQNVTAMEKYNMASLYKRSGDERTAEKGFKQLLKERSGDVFPLESGIYFHLGEIYLDRKSLQESRKMFQKCLERNPNHYKAKKYLLEEFRKK